MRDLILRWRGKVHIIKPVTYSDLFLLKDPFSNHWLRLDPLSEWLNEDKANKLAYGELRPTEPVVCKGFMGGPVADVLWTGLPFLFCVSQRVVGILQDNHFTGWSTYPVEVSDRKGNRVTGYYGFAVTSYAGERDLSRSPIIKRAPYVYGGGNPEVYKGFYFDENRWDGSDFFRVKTDIIVTRVVKEAIIKSKVRNIKFVALPDEETDTIVFMKFGKNPNWLKSVIALSELSEGPSKDT
jgi:hypothetical protein